LLEESHRVGRTIDDLLSLSRIEAEEELTHPAVPVVDVIEEAVARTAPAAEQREIRIEESPVPSVLAVEGDARQLVSALYNLLENAVKYSDPGSVVEVSAREEDGWAEMVVADSGPGIPTRDLERIFERFYRVDRGRSRDTGGTGLGLAIVRHVATNHGGEVTVQSREGEGSTFVLRLPAVAVPIVEGSLS
jgi:two-component system sensor histidine kinase SenX3